MNLTTEQKEVGRRNFLKAAAVLPPVAAFAATSWSHGPVKTGIIGTGVEGRILISQTDPKYVQIVAFSDIRWDNAELGKRAIVSRGHTADPKYHGNYIDLLEDPEIEAVMIASPLWQHGPMAIEALKRGKHVFTEKTMAMNMEECQQMVELAKQNGVHLQVGHQRFYNPLYWDAFRMYKEGLLGNVYNIRAGWHRNSDWDYWKLAKMFTTNAKLEDLFNRFQTQFDPKPFGYNDNQELVNWRWYSKFSRGMWTELCSHQLAITNWFFGDGVNDAVPKFAMATGGHYKVEADFPPPQSRLYAKDDRDIMDHVYAIFQYDENKTVTYSAIHSNSFDNYFEEIMGTRCTVILKNENEKYLFWEPGWDEVTAKKAADAERAGTKVETVKEDDHAESASAFAAHVSGQAKGGGGASDMNELEPYMYELQGFSHSIRTGAPNLCDGIRAGRAAQAAFAGQDAIANGGYIEIPNKFFG
ncbi:MAG: Gfo/Idh/MocA family oxidoreductase [bacterium]|jgi:predicted dehydrogenase|nr:Gfo/Idh/MocA family oxidoreductase [bacterium]